MFNLFRKSDRLYIQIAEKIHQRRLRQDGLVKRELVLEREIAEELLRTAVQRGVSQGELIAELLNFWKRCSTTETPSSDA